MRLRVKMLRSKDQLIKGESYNLPTYIAENLVKEGIATREFGPGEQPTIGPSETKPAGPSETKSGDADAASYSGAGIEAPTDGATVAVKDTGIVIGDELEQPQPLTEPSPVTPAPERVTPPARPTPPSGKPRRR